MITVYAGQRQNATGFVHNHMNLNVAGNEFSFRDDMSGTDQPQDACTVTITE